MSAQNLSSATAIGYYLPECQKKYCNWSALCSNVIILKTSSASLESCSDATFLTSLRGSLMTVSFYGLMAIPGSASIASGTLGGCKFNTLLPTPFLPTGNVIFLSCSQLCCYFSTDAHPVASVLFTRIQQALSSCLMAIMALKEATTSSECEA